MGFGKTQKNKGSSGSISAVFVRKHASCVPLPACYNGLANFVLFLRMKKPGLTLIELMVVLAILGMLMGMGWAGLSAFRREQQLQTAAENLKDYLRYARSSAMTTSVDFDAGGGSDLDWVYGYAVGLTSDGYDMYRYAQPLTGGVPDDDEIDLFWTDDDDDWWAVYFSGSVHEDGDTFSDVSFGLDECAAIGFQAVSGQMHVDTGAATCRIELTFGSRVKAVDVDTETGEIVIVEID